MASPIDLVTIAAGTGGFVIYGRDSYDESGFSVASAGDVNGDGFDDLIIGADQAFGASNDKPIAGESYVVFGKASGFGPAIDLNDVAAGIGGFVLYARDTYDSSGFSVASAGDLNGDGFDEVVIGAWRAAGADNTGYSVGESYVVFGKASGWGAAIALEDVAAGTGGFILYGENDDDFAGRSVASAGDVNGDGFDDLLIGAPSADLGANAEAGKTYVVFGKAGGWAATIDLSAVAAGTGGFVIAGARGEEQSGYSVASAGDVNGDGFDDLIIGAYAGGGADGNTVYAGETYVVFGKADGWDRSFGDPGDNDAGVGIDLFTLSRDTGTAGFVIYGRDERDYSGFSVASAGDVNGDGFADLIIGAHKAYAADNAKEGAGESYVVFGKASGWGAAINLADVAAGTGGFVLYGQDPYDNSGYSVASAGDVNGDGFDDIIIGAHKAYAADNGTEYAGESYVVFGKASGWGAPIDLGTIAAGTGGFVIYGQDERDYSGKSVASAGDLNGDGFDDLIVGATRAYAADNAKEGAGESYVIFGRDFTGAVTQAGTTAADTLTGTGSADVIVGGLGADTLIGNGGADAIEGGAGDDRIEVSDLSFRRIDGGSGTDTLVLTGTGITLDLAMIANSKLRGIEVIELGTNTLQLTQLEVLNLSDTSNTLRVIANSGASVLFDDVDGGWIQGERVGDLDTYTKGQATVLVLQQAAAPGITSGGTASFAENATGTVYTATGNNAEGDRLVSWALAGIDAGLFDIDAREGRVTFKVVPNFEAPTDTGGNNVYDIEVIGSDGPVSDRRAVAITVTNVNEGPRVTSGITATFAENGTGAAYTATGTDPDGTALVWSLGGVDAALFNIGASTGVVTFKVAPNFEVPTDAYNGASNVYDIEITAFDGGLSDTRAVAITVTDVYENDPPTITSRASASFAENSTGVAYTATGTDPNGDVLTWSLGGVDFARFNIDSASGAVTFKAAPDFEAPADNGANNVYNISVIAFDGALRTAKAVAITVTNVNEGPSVTSGITATFAENATGAVYTATGTDPEGTTLTWSLGGLDAGRFNIGAGTGVVTFKVAPDFEAPTDAYNGAANVYDISVIASDGALTASKAVAITVTNVNEAPTVFSAAAVNVAENTIGPVYFANGRDAEGATLTWSLGGTDFARFNINAISGEVTFKAVPNFEAPTDNGANNVYNISVIASDGVFRTPKAVAITVTNVNEGPGITSGAAVSVRENATGTVYAATGSDPDGTALTWSLGGVDAARFNIVASTGVVTFKAVPNFEAPTDAGANNVYDISVTASDGALTISKTVVITVTDVVESLTDLVAGTDFNVILTNRVGTFGPPPPPFRAGSSVASAGDVNNDGYDDLIIGAPDSGNQAGGSERTGSFVVFGKASGWESAIDLPTMGAGTGFAIYGEGQRNHAGFSVATAGDVNGDGFDDLIIGAPAAGHFTDSPATLGARSYVVFGKAGGFGTAIDLADVAAGTGGFVLLGQTGEYGSDEAGRSVASAGDVNNDGFDDLIIGAPGGDGADSATRGAGESYVVFGKASGWGAAIDLADVADGTGGFVLYGRDHGGQFGSSVASAGDVNGDGFDDVIIGAPYEYSGIGANGREGASYVVFGKASGWGASVSLNDIAAGSGGFVILGRDRDDRSGWSVASAGDVNGDGCDDLIIGAPSADANGNATSGAGESYVVFGKRTGWGASIDLADITAGTGGFVIHGRAADDGSSFSVASAGDVNRDGFADLIIAAGSGEVAVLFGKTSGWGAPIALADVAAGTGGFLLHGRNAGDGFGRSVASAGDLNGDGFADMIIGAPFADNAGVANDTGIAYQAAATGSGIVWSLTVTVVPPISTTSWLQSNWYASPGAKLSGTKAAVAVEARDCDQPRA